MSLVYILHVPRHKFHTLLLFCTFHYAYLHVAVIAGRDFSLLISDLFVKTCAVGKFLQFIWHA